MTSAPADAISTLDALLDAWRTSRSPDLETAIEALSERVTPGLPELENSDAWPTRHRLNRAIDIPVLLEALTAPPKSAMAARVRALASGPGDPRVGRVFLQMILEPPTTASSNFSMWSALFKALPRFLDQRAIPALQERADTLGGSSKFWPKLTGWIRAAIPKLPPTGDPSGSALIAQADTCAVVGLALPIGTTIAIRYDLDGVAALLQTDPAAALDELVAFWRAHRLPQVAHLIDKLQFQVEADIPEWIESPRSADIPALLDDLRSVKMNEVEDRLELMRIWAPDPRICRAMLTLINDVMLGARKRLWTHVYGNVVHHADVRVSEALATRRARLERRSIWDRESAERGPALPALDAYDQVVSTLRPLRERERTELEALESAIPGPDSENSDERALVRAVVENWDDDTPRRVYADWLTEQNDPRGPYIQLELALAAGKRVKGKLNTYFRKHKKALIGPLEGFLSYGDKWNRGFLSTVSLDATAGGFQRSEVEIQRSLTDSRWSVIETLRTHRGDCSPIFQTAPLDALTHLTCSTRDLESFGERTGSPLTRLRSLDLRVNHLDSCDGLDRALPMLPNVEHISVMIWAPTGGRMTPPQAFFDSELVRTAKVIRCGDASSGGDNNVVEWVNRATQAGYQGSIELISGYTLTLTPGTTWSGHLQVRDQWDVEKAIRLIAATPAELVEIHLDEDAPEELATALQQR